MADNFVKKASATDTLREMQRELDATLAQLAREEDDHERNSDHSSAIQLQAKSLSNLAAASPLATTHCIGPSASSKLNYIISEVIENSPLVVSKLVTTSNFLLLRFKNTLPEKSSSFSLNLHCLWPTSPKH